MSDLMNAADEAAQEYRQGTIDRLELLERFRHIAAGNPDALALIKQQHGFAWFDDSVDWLPPGVGG